MINAELIAKCRELSAKATPGPWAWESIAEKSNEFAVGQAFKEDDNGEFVAISGRIDGPLEDVVIERRLVGFNESGSANFADAEFIAESRTLLDQLADALEQVTQERDLAREIAKRWAGIPSSRLTPKQLKEWNEISREIFAWPKEAL